MRRYRWWLAAGLALAATAAVALAAAPITGDFAVNVTTAGVQERADVDMDADGDSVVVWQGPDADGTGVFARRVSAAGVPQGAADIPVNGTTAGAQGSPAVAVDADGDFAVVWEGPDATGRGIFARRFNAAGAALGAEIPVNATTAGDQTRPGIAMDSDGDVAVVWEGADANGRGVFARRFNAAGTPQGGEIPVNTTIAGMQVQPAVAMDPDGDFVVAWDSAADVLARRFDAGGSPQGAELEVEANDDPSQSDSSSSVAMDADGDFIVAWFRRGVPSNEPLGTFAQRFSADGTAQCGEIPAHIAAFRSGVPDVAMDADGDFVVVWADGGTGDIQYRPFDASGAPLFGGETVNERRFGLQRDPSVASAPDGNLVFAWDGEGNNSGEDTRDHDGVYARRFGVDPPPTLPVLRPPFDGSYSVHDVGPPPGVPAVLGGLTVKAGAPDRLLIGGDSGNGDGALYEIGVTRDGAGHITGFSGCAAPAAEAPFNTGGVAYGPPGAGASQRVLFVARSLFNELGQIIPGSPSADRVIDVGGPPHNVASSLKSLQFVPRGLPGAGSFKLVSSSGDWYDAAVAPDGSGTYDLLDVTPVPGSKLPGLTAFSSGFAYVNPGSPEFTGPSLLLSESSSGVVGAYPVGSDGDPVIAVDGNGNPTRPVFLTAGFPVGAAIDPLTGDFLFATFPTSFGTNVGHVIAVRGFARPTATLRVVKEVVNDNGGSADPADFSVHVKGGGADVTGSPQPGDPNGTEYTLPANATYTVSEDPAAGYDTRISGDCDALGAVALEPGDTKTCRIVNDDIGQSAPPKLRVVKQVVNDDGGTRTAGDFSVHVKAAGADVTGSPQPGSGSGTEYTLDPGTYTVSEDAVAGYAATFAGDCAANGTVTLAAGQVKTCTVTNNDVAPTLTVVKQVVKDHGGTAAADAWTMHIRSGGADVTGSPFPGAPAPGVTRTLTAGTYAVSESGGPAGYAASFSGECNASGQVTLQVGENETCTVTNDDIAPTLTVIKEVVNDDGGTATANAWTMHIRSGGTDVTGSPFPGTGAPGVTRTLRAGTFAVGESGGPAGYAASFSGGCNASGQVTLELGEAKTCTVTNDDIAPTLTVIKQVVNDDGGIAAADAWTMHIRAGVPLTDVAGSPFPGAPAPGVTRTLTAGTYVVGESGGPAGYAASFAGECNASGQVTLQVGETETCTIVNDDVSPSAPPRLKVVKQVVNDHGGTRGAGDFSVHVKSAGVDVTGSPQPGSETGTEHTLDPGTYTVSEDPVAGYAATLAGDCAADGTVTLATGEVKTCTVTNDDIAPTLTVIKQVVNDDGGNAVAANWTIHVQTGIPLADVAGSPFPGAPAPGVTRSLRVGTFVVSETGPGGYEGSFSGDCNSSGQVSLGLADNKTCTIVNDEIAVPPPPPPPPPGPPPPPPPPELVAGNCQGRRPTHRGTNGDDQIRGTNRADVILAGRGDDVITARNGKDLICAGGGNDGVRGGYTQDRGPDTADVVHGGPGNDVLSGNQGNDQIFGEEGNDFINAGTGRDLCRGGPGRNNFRSCERRR